MIFFNCFKPVLDNNIKGNISEDFIKREIYSYRDNVFCSNIINKICNNNDHIINKDGVYRAYNIFNGYYIRIDCMPTATRSYPYIMLLREFVEK